MFYERDCLVKPLVNCTPSNIDILYLNKMREFISQKLDCFLKKYLKNI